MISCLNYANGQFYRNFVTLKYCFKFNVSYSSSRIIKIRLHANNEIVQLSHDLMKFLNQNDVKSEIHLQ
ncbi:hypothetical protein GYMC10_3210 [Paenibacillus sp. Y412MC10]|nr:hypothetical protein GYMC10_3210 [Paenibacillus sp. Y412MC10]